jgi:CelD/BcsL family acetyltransferase involved in cellulose biosynthesis
MRRAAESEVPVTWYVLQDSQKVEEDTAAFLELMAEDAEKAAFLTPRMREQMARTILCAFETGCLNLAFLEVGGQKAAAYMSFDYLNRLWVYNSGIRKSLMEYSPGWVLLGYLLQWANEKGYTEFDFMRGDEEYKYRFGAVDRFVCRLTVEKPVHSSPAAVQ